MVIVILIFLCLLAATFGVRPANASGPVYIRADGNVEPPEAPIQRNEDLYTLTANITSAADGIVIEKDGITIEGNGHTLQGGVVGNAFYLYGVSNVTIRNTRTRGFNYGMYLESTSGNIIQGNDIAESTYDGISLYDAPNNIVLFNRIEDNDWSGVGLYYSSDNNITGNYIAGNYLGVSVLGSELNSMFHNTLVSNTNQASSDNLPNTWDNGYPSGGNYWSDYSGVDTRCGPNQDYPGSDGIGDTPYTIDSENTDRYPLMNPWIPPSGHDVAVISALSYKTAIGQGYSGNITVYCANRGEYAETFNITLYSDTIPFASKTVHLEGGLTANTAFLWNTTGFAKDNYTLSASADTVPGETNTTNNNFTGGWVVVVIVGDITGPIAGVPDGTVNMRDIGLVAKHFAETVPPAQPNCDLTGSTRGVPDGKIDMRDVGTVASNFGKTSL